jgi:glycosyltransferase involved in cell wall biosynthesis
MSDGPAPSLVIATILPSEGTTGVQTHFRELRRYLDAEGTSSVLLTPFSWARPLTYPVFAVRLGLVRISPAAAVAWYRYGHEVFIRGALRRHLARAGDCVVYAQCPLSARAALKVRRGPHQRVVMAVHFRVSQADEFAETGEIPRGGRVFRAIRRTERDVIPGVDGLVYVSRWARDALTDWLPAAAPVPAAVIGNFVTPAPAGPGAPRTERHGDLVTIGGLEPVKNHAFMFKVLAEARRAGRTLTLDVFGDGPLRAELERQAEVLGIAGQVRFRGFRPDVRDFLPGYRAYVHASYSESSSLAIMEAMAAGLPIVAADIGPIAELCDDGVEARFWSLEDPAKAASTLLALVGSEEELAAAGAAARDRFRREHDAAVVAPRLTEFLLAGLAPSGP